MIYSFMSFELNTVCFVKQKMHLIAIALQATANLLNIATCKQYIDPTS